MTGTRWRTRIALSCLVVWLLLSSAIGIVAVEGALHPGRERVSSNQDAQAQAVAARNNSVLSDVSVAEGDGVLLRAWLVRPLPANGDAVILLHGQGDNRAGMLSNADLLLRHGYTVLLPDARAQGESDGAIATYGVKESADIRGWYDWLHASIPGCIDGLGDSMGAAQLLLSLQVEPGFCAVVAESGFASFQEAAYDRLGQEFNAGPWVGRTLLRPALWTGLLYARFRYNVDLQSASPENSVARTRVPILLIHGLADTNLPPRHSEAMKARNPAIVLWEPAGAEHCGASATAPAEYETRVIGWFQNHSRAAVLLRRND